MHIYKFRRGDFMKKILSLLLVAVMLVTTVFSITAFAAKNPIFVVSSQKAKAGDTVKITVSTKNNTGIVSMKLLVKYNSKALDLVEYKEGKFKNTAFSPENSNPFVINWLDSIHPNNKTNGIVATLTFKVLDTAPEGKSEITLTYDPEDVFDLNFNNVTFAVQNGYVDITNPKAPSSQTQETQSETSEPQPTNPESSNPQSTPSQDAQTSSDTFNDTTVSQILGQIHDSANDNQGNDKPTTNAVGNVENNVTVNVNASSDWIIWVVVAACVLLVGAFAVVIIKNKKDKTK